MGRRTRIEQDEIGPVVPRRRSARTAGTIPPRRGHTSIAFLIFLLIALIGGGALTYALHNQGGKSTPRAQQAKRVVVFLVDGASTFPPASMPVVSRLGRQGTVYDHAWIGQWPGVRPTSGATVGSGVFPRRSGIAGSSWRDPTTNREVQPTEPSAVRLGSLDQILEARHPSLTPIASVIKDRNPQSKILAVGGVGCAEADAAASWLADYVMCIARKGKQWVESPVTGHDLPAGVGRTGPAPVATGGGLGPQVEGWQLGQQDDQVARNAIAAIRATHPKLTIVEFPEPAAVGALAPSGQRDSVLRTLLAGIDRDIGRVEAALRSERLLSGTAFVVTSGEALSALQHKEAVSSFRDAVIAAGGVPVYVHGTAAASIALQDSRGAQGVALAIEQSRLSGVDAIFYRSKHAGKWRFQAQYLDPLLKPSYQSAVAALLATAAAAEAPDVVAVYAPHAGTAVSEQGLKATSTSGGFSWDTQHVPLVLSGPGVLDGKVSHYPARLVDLAPTIESLLGLTPSPGDGTVLADSLVRAPNGAGDLQQRRQQQLTPVVNALINRLRSTG